MLVLSIAGLDCCVVNGVTAAGVTGSAVFLGDSLVAGVKLS